jgi:hypothetical protein
MTSEHSFRDEILQESALLAAQMQTFQREAFTTLVLEKFVDNNDIPAYEHCYYTFNSAKGSIEIDAYSIDDTDGSISLFLFDLNKQDIQTINTTMAMTVFRKLERFIEGTLAQQLQIDISHPAYELSDIIYRRYHNKELTDIEMITQKYKLFYVSNNPTSERFKYTIEKNEINGKIIEYNVWDINRLESNWHSTTPEMIEIDVTQYVPSGIPCLLANEVQSAYKSFLCIIPGHILADLYIEYGSRLLEGNVRSYLSATRKVNRGIRNTALNESNKFFVYNNGISATASSVIVQTNNAGLYITNITNLQIVNGAQTTATLAEVRRTASDSKKQLPDVFVQMKLTEVDINQSETLIPNISRYSNSQNSVSEVDFFANHPYHLEIEKLSRRIQAPAKANEQYETFWYYERLRAQYSNDLNRNRTKRDRELFLRRNPKSQIITKTDLAKSLGCWQLEPHIVSRGAQKNFIQIAPKIIKLWNSDPTHSQIHEFYFQNLIAMTIIYRTTQSVVSEQSWYAGGYRANIVAYTISKLIHHIETKHPKYELNLQLIWRTQQVPDLLVRQIAVISKAAFDVIMTPLNRIGNISEWAKRENCWKQLEKTDVLDVPDFQSLLIASEQAHTIEISKRKDQSFVNAIDMLAQLLKLRELHPELLTNLKNFLKSERITISPRQTQALNSANNDQRIPNERDAIECIKLLNQAEEKGFRY